MNWQNVNVEQHLYLRIFLKVMYRLKFYSAESHLNAYRAAGARPLGLSNSK